MFSMKSFQDKQPISWTGAIRHSLMWLLADLTELVYKNPRFTPTEQNPKGIAIYCIHGTADRVSAFSLIARRLLNHLPTDISCIHLIKFNVVSRIIGNGIEHFVTQAKDTIKKNNDENIILMGHSRGGLIAADLAVHITSEDKINILGVIPICSPFSGSSFALPPLTWFSKSIHQMQKESAYLKDLNAKIILSPIKFYYVAAENDAIVAVESSYIKEKYQAQITLPRHGHLSIMSSQKLILHLVNYIKESLSHLNTPYNNNDEIILSDDETPSYLFELYYEIDMLIAEFKSQHFLLQSKHKIETLEKFRTFIFNILENNIDKNEFKEISIDMLIKVFLQQNNFYYQNSTEQWIHKVMHTAHSFFNFIPTVDLSIMDALINKYEGKQIVATNNVNNLP